MTTSFSFSTKNPLPFSLYNSQHTNSRLHNAIIRPNTITPPLILNTTSEYYTTLPDKPAAIHSSTTKLSPISLNHSATKTPLRFISQNRTHSRNSTKSMDKMDFHSPTNSPLTKPSPSNFLLNNALSKKRVLGTDLDQSTSKTPTSSALINLKKLDKWALPSPKASPMSDGYCQNFSSASNKKYKFRINKLSFSKGGAPSADPDIEMIKKNVKIQGKRSLKLTLECKEALSEMKEINITKKKGQMLTEEEEKQVKLLRKKVEISNIFESKVMSEEEKKQAYRQMILEFHPDKTKHEIDFALGVFYFLQTHKERFVGGSDK